MPNNELTLVEILLDGSGSMSSTRQGVIDGLNEFIDEQKRILGRVLLNMVQFNSTWDGSLNYKKLQHFKDIHEIDKLTLENYVPNGGTPLLAAVTTAIEELGRDLVVMPENERPGKVVFMIVTDGQENTSDRTKFSKSKVREMVQHQTNKYNWEFLFLGSNQDAFAEAGGVGVSINNTATYSGTYFGSMNAIRAASASVSNYRSMGSTLNLNDTLKDIEAEEEKAKLRNGTT